MSESLTHMPASDKWEFDQSVTEVFSDMLERSVPGYETMRELVFGLGSRFVLEPRGGMPRSEIVDLGCSNGLNFERFVRRFGATVTYLGIEVSKPMVAAARSRWSGLVDSGLMRINEADLRELAPLKGLPTSRTPSLVMSILTLMFVPVNYRQQIVASVRRSMMGVGSPCAFILVEKVLGSGDTIDAVLVEEHEQLKQRNGYSDESVARKRASLEGVLVPLTAAWNEIMLRNAGFSQVDCFWRSLNFAGWIATI